MSNDYIYLDELASSYAVETRIPFEFTDFGQRFHAFQCGYVAGKPQWTFAKHGLPTQEGVYLVVVVGKDRRPKMTMLRLGKRKPGSGWSAVTHWMPLPELPTEDK